MLSQSLLLSPNYKSTKTCGARILHLINRDPKVKTESGIRDNEDWVRILIVVIIIHIGTETTSDIFQTFLH